MTTEWEIKPKMTATSVPFKIYLKRDGEQPEIRRFHLEREVATNYSYLRQKIYTLFPSLQSVGFSMTWKDADGDEISIFTDEELLIALNEMTDVSSGYKIFVIPGIQAKKTPVTVVHEGVICDNCDREVIGFRYKCVVCPDYDLCSDCENKYNHKEHIMLRFPFMVSRDVHMRRKLLKEMFKFTKHCDGFPGDLPPHKRHHHKFHHRGPPPPPPPPFDYSRKCPFMASDNENDWVEMAQAFVSNLKSSVETVTPVLIQEIVAALNNLRCDDETTANETKKAKVDGGDEKTEKTMPSTSNEKEQKQHSSQTPPSALPDMPAPQVPNFVDLTNSFLNPIVNQLNRVDPSLIPNIVQTLNGFHPTPTPATPLQPQPTTQNTSTSPDKAQAATKETQVENRESPTIEGFVDIGMDDIPSPQPSTSTNSSNPQVETALQKMLSLGFNNEGNWLKEMLNVANGDINLVLDMIAQSVQEQKKQTN